ncbi:50S ribosomal protein L17 [Tichowtungia aerotolerans]|uniref:Large ribosomal subunit protein bL17 n=1 Tax=Tichowtungia aerotolerans TaxID=2697043 RepID=A0A6P1M6U1_9BACT|nr:50S ribosomal protein L17 [Tichowtungia aerotolerans]QHI69571.1 50S ribosomal protein L17 [Tichowtungia aerotolerans]
MRHRVKKIKLGRRGAHRDSMLANMVCSLIAERRIKTTLSKAKVVAPMAEKMVTLGKKGTLAARRQALSALKQETVVQALFDEIAPGFANRAGGYTRITKLGPRMSDASEMAIIEWVEAAEPAAAEK